MNADEDHAMNALRFEHFGMAVTVTGSGRFWFWAVWGTRSAFIGVHRRVLDFLCEDRGIGRETSNWARKISQNSG